jgi:hypothetical protein
VKALRSFETSTTDYPVMHNSNINEDIATKFEQHMAWCHISHTTNVLLFKFRCNILIGVRTIKEMPVSVANGTLCSTVIPENITNFISFSVSISHLVGIVCVWHIVWTQLYCVLWVCAYFCSCWEMTTFIFGIVLYVCFALFQVSETWILPQRNFIVVSTRKIVFLRGLPTNFAIYRRPYLRVTHWTCSVLEVHRSVYRLRYGL